jgi:AraC family transcriptional regulator
LVRSKVNGYNKVEVIVLAAESLANVLAVHLIRHVSAPRRLERGRDGVLPRGRLRAVEEYIEEHLDGCPTLAQLAAVVRLNPYHFARQFKAATGLPPHQFVITRRVERAKELLQAGTDLSLVTGPFGSGRVTYSPRYIASGTCLCGPSRSSVD